MNSRCLIVGLVFLAMACGRKPPPTFAEFSQDIFVSRNIVSGSEHFRYRVFIPPDRKDGEQLPVMLYLHGSDERGEDNEGQLSGVAPAVLSNPGRFRFIIVFPQCPLGRFWDRDIVARAMTELDQTIREFGGDQSRLYLAGFSLGGYGAWHTAAMYPTRFAAIVPMSGRVLPRPGERKDLAPEILELADAKDPYRAFAERLRTTPIWIFHGANDAVVPVESSRQMLRALTEVGNENTKYSELENTTRFSDACI